MFGVNLPFCFVSQSDGRAAVPHGEVKTSDDKVQACCSTLPRPVPGPVRCLGSQ